VTADISVTAGSVRLRDFTGVRCSVAVGSVLSLDFKDGRSWSLIVFMRLPRWIVLFLREISFRSVTIGSVLS